MPVINFGYNDLCHLMGEEIPVDRLIETIPMMGADLHHYDEKEMEIAIEFFPDRPDLYSVEGVARNLKCFMGLAPGLTRFDVADPVVDLHVDPSVKSIRPFIVAAVVRDVTMTDALIRSLMEMQEKLHLTLGRKRAKVSIGIHDMDAVRPPFTYKGVMPDSVRFVPLTSEREMDLDEVLDLHDKGRDYAHLVKGKELYPLLTDADGEVLSFPPIINGRLTTITDITRNIFIDVTGTDMATLVGALNIITTSLHERGAKLEAVRVHDGETFFTPDLNPMTCGLECETVNQFLGLELSENEMVKALERMGHDAIINENGLHVLSPATRMDLLHPVDLMEDVAIGYGYERFGERSVDVPGMGSELPMERLSDMVRQMMIGYGYSEVTTLILNNEEDQFGNVGLALRETIRILNPITEDHTCLRVHLIPSLLNVLRKNKHRDLPQRIFEVGDVIDGMKKQRHLAMVSVHPKANFTEMKSLAQGILRDLGLEHAVTISDSGMFINGRGAKIIVGGRTIGEFGEMSPKAINLNRLGYPIACMEIDLLGAVEERLDHIL